MKKLALHWKIMIGMILGILFGIAANQMGYENTIGSLEMAKNATISNDYLEETKITVRNLETDKKEELNVLIKGKNKMFSPSSYQIKNGMPIYNAVTLNENGAMDIIKPADANKYKFIAFNAAYKKPSGLIIKKDSSFVMDWIAPFGKIFVNLLKLIAIPLILASLIKGISDLKDISKFRNIGVRTIVIYIFTTVIAITIGLGLVNIIKPGSGISKETIEKLTDKYATNDSVTKKLNEATKQQGSGPLDFLVDMVPSNAVKAFGDNGKMLQVIFFAIFLGICMLLVKPEQAKPMKDFFDSLNEIVLKMVDIIMLTAPFAVFALLAQVVVSSDDPDILLALLKYAMVVVGGLVTMIGFYCLVVYFFVGKNPLWFLKEISPAQLLAFSTSSSAATLPVTMERVEEHIGVDKEVSSFVLPVGATINMDGTSLYQAVAAVFIAQALHYDLSMSDQLVIVATALLASIGSAAVPGAGMVMLVIVLEAVGFPADKLAIGLALIFAVDRPLDMCRTTVNVTGDATVAMLVAKSVGKLGTPKRKDWDDNYKG